ncbi:MAG TPA: N-acetyltransferase, partial [Thermoplasmatales archaeon]|nr:N-acetyltransferase [Thermoplasmatales archaeon]
RKRRIENNYTDAQELYNAAVRLHGREEMLNYLTSVYLLDSLDAIKKVVKGDGEFMVLKEEEKIIGIAGYKKSVQYRPLDDEKNIVTLDDAWEFSALLVDKNRRGEGYGWRLFNHVMSRLKKKTKEVYIPVTGTFDAKKKGKPRVISRRVEEYCKYMNGKLVGYAPKSYGPVYLIRCNYME